MAGTVPALREAHCRMPFFYILTCSDGSFYCGSTHDLSLRFWQHESGLGSAYTSKRLPVALAHCEEYDTMHEAFLREKQVQGWGRAKRIALIEGRVGDLPALSRSRQARPESG
ncbi:hypothetical protein GCM10022239_10140 [Leifsonia bigeumensis]|uniref:GIY-YIG domain-containing protein n=2 Tax=Leifsonella bigeumensis TaxID=433643 RepID=A0ABP7FD85_9MICO